MNICFFVLWGFVLFCFCFASGRLIDPTLSAETLPATRPTSGLVIKAVPPFESSTREKGGEVWLASGSRSQERARGEG